MTSAPAARRDDPPAGRIILGAIAIVVSITLISDWAWQWSDADTSIRWFFPYVGMLLIPGGLGLVTLGAREAGRRHRRDARSGWFRSEHPLDSEEAPPTGRGEIVLGSVVFGAALALVCDGVWSWSGGEFVYPWIPIAFGFVFMLVAVRLIISGQRRTSSAQKHVGDEP